MDDGNRLLKFAHHMRIAENEGDIGFVVVWYFARFEGVVGRYRFSTHVGGDRREVNKEVVLVVSSSGPLRGVKHCKAFGLAVL